MEAPFAVKLVRNVGIPMPDGVTLAADPHMPEAAGRFPAIIEYTPYHKNNNHVYGPRATRYAYFASHGYIFVNVDIRDTGDSEGFNSSPTSPEKVRDNLEVIRWCARQPWCDGSIGMIGISYTAGVCYDAARQAPSELKAIVVCQMISDWYDGMACPGGSPRPFAYENYAPLMAAYNLRPAPRGPGQPAVGRDLAAAAGAVDSLGPHLHRAPARRPVLGSPTVARSRGASEGGHVPDRRLVRLVFR